MAVTEIRIPQTDVNDETVQLSRWLVADGSRVEQGTAILAFEASKAAVDLETPAAGFLRHGAAKGEVVPVGAVVGWLAPNLEELPAAGTSATPTAPAAVAGAMAPAAPGAAAPGAAAAGATNTAGEGTAEARATAAAAGGLAAGGAVPAGVARASRKAQELAASQGIDLASLRVAGIITERHVQEAIAARQATMQASPAPAGAMVAVAALAPGTAPADHPAPAVFLETPAAPARTSPVSRVQAAIARQVLHATQSRASAFVILRCEVDATLHALERMLEQKKRFLAFPEVLVYHVARCLRQLPRLNAVLIGDTIHEYQQVNLAFTVDIAGRLYTPVIHDADRLSLLETSTAMQGRKLQILRGAPPEASLRGGTFTVSVLDTAGLLYQLPIINRGQSAILGAGARVRELIPDENGAPRVVTTVGLCLTYDHRLLNGSQAAAFLAAVAERLGRDPEAEG